MAAQLHGRRRQRRRLVAPAVPPRLRPLPHPPRRRRLLRRRPARRLPAAPRGAASKRLTARRAVGASLASATVATMRCPSPPQARAAVGNSAAMTPTARSVLSMNRPLNSASCIKKTGRPRVTEMDITRSGWSSHPTAPGHRHGAHHGPADPDSRGPCRSARSRTPYTGTRQVPTRLSSQGARVRVHWVDLPLVDVERGQIDTMSCPWLASTRRHP